MTFAFLNLLAYGLDYERRELRCLGHQNLSFASRANVHQLRSRARFMLSQSTSITHRIINVTDGGFITKGDANEDPDQWTVKRENVIGKVTFTIPYSGYTGYFVRTPIGFILLIIIPATLLIINEIIKIIKYQKQTQKEKNNSKPE